MTDELGAYQVHTSRITYSAVTGGFTYGSQNHNPSTPTESHMSTTADSLPIQEIITHLSRQVAALTDALAAPRADRLWADIKDAVRIFGVPAKTIKLWASQGYVRKAKLGPTFQSKSTYSVEDINALLSRAAVGKPPVSALRKGD